jgi:hypothetical protein
MRRWDRLREGINCREDRIVFVHLGTRVECCSEAEPSRWRRDADNLYQRPSQDQGLFIVARPTTASTLERSIIEGVVRLQGSMAPSASQPSPIV